MHKVLGDSAWHEIRALKVLAIRSSSGVNALIFRLLVMLAECLLLIVYIF